MMTGVVIFIGEHETGSSGDMIVKDRDQLCAVVTYLDIYFSYSALNHINSAKVLLGWG